MSREHHKIPLKIFLDLQNWKIMGASMGRMMKKIEQKDTRHTKMTSVLFSS